MDWVTILLLLLAGLVLLVAGGELLVRGASSVATAFGISPLVIGLTVVAFGTSSPEMAVSIQAGMAGNPDIAVGNVVGSNIFNVLFILGACALILPLVVSRQLVRREVPIMIGISFLLLLLVLDGNIGLLDGVLLFAGIIGYTSWSVIASRRETAAARGTEESVTINTIAAKSPLWLGGAVAVLALAVAGFFFGWFNGVHHRPLGRSPLPGQLPCLHRVPDPGGDEQPGPRKLPERHAAGVVPGRHNAGLDQCAVLPYPAARATGGLEQARVMLMRRVPA